jgi:hypothetical protein
MLFPRLPTRHEGWAAGLHRHHDHANDTFRYGRSGTSVPVRFAETVICEQCNSADGTAKKKLGLPAEFSFSPVEMRQFVRATPHGFHEIDYAAALAVFQVIDRSTAFD